MFPWNLGRIAPEVVQIIIGPRFGAENVDDDIDKIDDDPGLSFIAGSGMGVRSQGGGGFFEILADTVHLPLAGAGCDDKKIRDRPEARQIEYHNVFTARVGGNARGFNRQSLGGAGFGFG